MKKKFKPVVNKIAELAFVSLARFRRLFGRRVSMVVGTFIGSLLYLATIANRKRYAETLDSMRLMSPSEDDKELKRTLYKVCRHFGRFVMEGFGFPLLDKEKIDKLVTIEGMEFLDKALEKKKGVVLATAHFGHFELALAALAILGTPVWFVIRTVDSPVLDRLIDSFRSSTGVKNMKKENAARNIIKRLREGSAVAVNIDQNAAFNHVFVPFFGKLAATFTTPAIMGIRTGATVLPLLSFRDDLTDSYKVRIYPPVEPPLTGDRKADARFMTMELNKILENAIREAPEQWLWIHRRWKTRPNREDLTAHDRDMKIINTHFHRNLVTS